MQTTRRTFLQTSLSIVALGLGIQALAAQNPQDKSTQTANANQAISPNQVVNPSKEAARNAAKNPFTLVYGGAIAKNEKGKVWIEPLRYLTPSGIQIAANLYLPPNFSKSKRYKAIVIAHPNGGVKEQVAGLYAQNLAQNGYITLAFDAAYQGASGGLPRNVDTPSNRTNDIFMAVSFLSNHKSVDSKRIGVLGICGGGGYAVKAAQSDRRIKAVAALSLFNTGRARRNGFLDSDLAGMEGRLSAGVKAKSEEMLGKIAYTGSAPKALNKAELEKIPAGLYREGVVYYGDTHAHPRSTFAYTSASLLELISFDVSDRAELITQPLKLLVGDRADSAYMSEEVYEKAVNAKNKELVRLKNATHIDTYYKPHVVKEAMEELTRFFKENLG